MGTDGSMDLRVTAAKRKMQNEEEKDEMERNEKENMMKDVSCLFVFLYILHF